MTNILQVVAAPSQYKIAYPIVKYTVCNYLVFRPCDPECKAYVPCNNSIPHIANQIAGDIVPNTTEYDIITDLQNDRCKIIVDLMNDWSGGNLLNAIPVMNVEQGVESDISPFRGTRIGMQRCFSCRKQRHTAE